MKNNLVVVNASNLVSGGGYTILRNFYCHAPLNSIFIVKNDGIANQLKSERRGGPKLVVPPVFFTKPWGLFLFYFWWVNRFCEKNNAAELISLGNIASKTKIKQKLYIHWPYYVYGVSAGGDSSFIVKVKRLVRYFFIARFSKYSEYWIVQTNAMKRKLLASKEKNEDFVLTIYPGFEQVSPQAGPTRKKKDVNNLKLIYPSFYYSHKNFEILLCLLDKAKYLDNGFSISLTLPEDVYNRLGFKQKRYVNNLGVLSKGELEKSYLEHDALIMPTKLETFGLPYLEAMSCGLPILTSDKDFSRDICKDYAFYFNPDSVESIVSSIEELREGVVGDRDFIKEGNMQLLRFNSWKDSVSSVFNEVS
ncbi:glycosyltransferase [Marinobacter adhaerens]|uniref:Glycosyltransferase n=1 Tax=Marinobacter adhaerens TaxID=1033846 RepID=A0A851HWZ5_9GAMM|nr:glycosyltransferase [Marinobacter adhaerens]NWN91782.1 glycosyltransferase [Marinobacter adhaerens]